MVRTTTPDFHHYLEYTWAPPPEDPPERSYVLLVLYLLYMLGVFIYILVLVVLGRKSPIQQHQVTVYLIALAACHLLTYSFTMFPSLLLRVLPASESFEVGFCKLTYYLYRVGATSFGLVLLALLIDRWLRAMMYRFPGTCFTRLGNKICCLFTARLLTCLCFVEACLVNLVVFFSSVEFYNHEFCSVFHDTHTAAVLSSIRDWILWYIPLFAILIMCLFFSALCCPPRRPAGYSTTDEGVKDDILSATSETRLTILIVVCSVAYFLTEMAFIGLYGVKGAFVIIEAVSTIYGYFFPFLSLLVIEEYRQQIISLCRGCGKKEGEAAILLRSKHP